MVMMTVVHRMMQRLAKLLARLGTPPRRHRLGVGGAGKFGLGHRNAHTPL